MGGCGFIPGSLGLDCVLETWLGLNLHCVQKWQGDVPWRYNERAMLSYFAGAIWRSGGFALEEYWTHRVGRKYFGRADLWFEIEDREYDVEAKHCRILLNHRFMPEKALGRCLDGAIADISRSTQYDSRRRACALASCSLAIDMSREHRCVLPEGAEHEERVSRWIAAVKSAGDACAWFINENGEWGKPVDGMQPELLFPGVALILKEVRR